MIIVVDTNVLVSALLSSLGAAARIIDLALVGDVQLAYDDRILTEYREVLARPKFAFPTEEVEAILDVLQASGFSVSALPLDRQLPDMTDQAFLEVAVCADAPLITGNQRHFPPDQCAPIRVYSPAEFWLWWEGGKR